MGGMQLQANSAKAAEASEDYLTRVYEAHWALGGLFFPTAFADIFIDPAANRTAAEFVRGKIRALVHDPATAALLTPLHLLGCKRTCVDTNFYATFNRDNVKLVDVNSAPIQEITPTGLRTESGFYELDSIVFATGYDAITGALSAIDLRGRGGMRLSEAWAGGPRTYLGLTTAGFPNLFIIAGPGTPAVLNNVVATIEQNVAWIARCIAAQEAAGATSFEATEAAQEDWVNTVNAIADQMIFPSCNSWYIGANIPGKPRVFMPYAGGLPAYRQKCDAVEAAFYDGFIARDSASM
jgi:cyclohexanone monooxygenase